MSNGATTLMALAFGAGSGFLLWHLLDDDEKKSAGGAAPPAPPDAPRAGAPPRVAGPCSLKLDAGGLTADGEVVTVLTAVERGKASGKAELAYANTGPAAVYAELTTALHVAGVPVNVKKP